MNLVQISRELHEVFLKWGATWTQAGRVKISKTPSKEEILQQLREMISDLETTKSRYIHRPGIGLLIIKTQRTGYWIGISAWNYDSTEEELIKK